MKNKEINYTQQIMRSNVLLLCPPFMIIGVSVPSCY
jgi:hypothetical protein